MSLAPIIFKLEPKLSKFARSERPYIRITNITAIANILSLFTKEEAMRVIDKSKPIILSASTDRILNDVITPIIFRHIWNF